jgi:hypothetical protein
MLGTFNKAFMLTDAQYQDELAKRRDYLTKTNGWDRLVGCPGCFEPPAPPQRAQSQ